VHLDTIESSIYPTDAQLDCSKNVKIYMTGAPTCFGFSQPSSGSYCMCFAEVISINNQLKYVVYRIFGSSGCIYLSSPYWCVCVRAQSETQCTAHTPLRTG
jgi:hypothetical protein